MKVGIDTSRFNAKFDGGKEQVLLNLLRGFHENGVDDQLRILCFRNRLESFKERAPRAEYWVMEDIFLSKSFSDRIIRRFRKWKLKYYYLRKLASSDIDVLFVANKGSHNFKFPVPSVVLAHDIQPISRPDANPDRSWRRTAVSIRKDFKYKDKVIAISGWDEKEMLEFLPQYRDKIYKIYNPIYCESIVDEGERKNILVLNAGYLHKNTLTLLKAFNRIKDKTDHRLVIAGRFEVPKYLEYIKNNDLDKYITLTGFLPEEELQQLICQSRLFVSSSLFEGFGMTPIEAIIKGVPTIVYKGCASYETTMGLCDYYENGTDDEELANKMLEVLNREIDYEELKEKSRILADAYDYKKIAGQYWKLFEEMDKNHNEE